MNDSEREQWILNDEGLYNWYKSSRLGVHSFIKQNRDELTKLIQEALK